MQFRLAVIALSSCIIACGCDDLRVKPASTLEPDSTHSAVPGAGSRVISNAERLEIAQAALAPNGDVLIGGSFEGELRLGNQLLRSPPNSLAGFLARLDSNGRPVSSHLIASETGVRLFGVTATADGDTLVMGEKWRLGLVADNSTLFVLRVSQRGRVVWKRTWDRLHAVAFAANSAGQSVVSARFYDKVDFEGRRFEYRDKEHRIPQMLVRGNERVRPRSCKAPTLESSLVFKLEKDGALAWVKQFDEAPQLAAIGTSKVFVDAGGLQAFELNSSDESWNVRPRVGLTHGVLLADNAGGVLYLNNSNQLTRFDSNGAETWHRSTRTGPPGSTAMSLEANGNLLVAWGYSSTAAPDPSERSFEPTTLVLRLDANGNYLASAEPDGRFDRHFVLPAPRATCGS